MTLCCVSKMVNPVPHNFCGGAYDNKCVRRTHRVHHLPLFLSAAAIIRRERKDCTHREMPKNRTLEVQIVPKAASVKCQSPESEGIGGGNRNHFTAISRNKSAPLNCN